MSVLTSVFDLPGLISTLKVLLMLSVSLMDMFIAAISVLMTDELAQASQLMQVDRVRELGMEYQTVQEELEGAYLQWGKALASVERSGMGPETT